MILPSHTVTLIQQGKVTCVILPRLEARSYQVGSSYGVQSWKPREGGGAPVVSEEKLRVEVTALERTTLSYELRDQVIEAAGFEAAGDLWEFWRARYQTGPLADPAITIVHFEIDAMRPERYLAPKGGYTSSPRRALRTPAGGEPVAPDLEVERAVPIEWERGNSRDARMRFSRSKAQEEARLEARSRAARLKEAENAAQRRGVDVGDLQRRIDDAIDEMRGRESNGGEEAA